MPERETLTVDVLIVGAGPAGLSCAIRLHDELDRHARQKGGPRTEKPSILVIEKGISTGAHSLSGAVLDPRALDELIPDWRHHGAPLRQRVTSEEILFLTPGRKVPVPLPV